MNFAASAMRQQACHQNTETTPVGEPFGFRISSPVAISAEEAGSFEYEHPLPISASLFVVGAISDAAANAVTDAFYSNYLDHVGTRGEAKLHVEWNEGINCCRKKEKRRKIF